MSRDTSVYIGPYFAITTEREGVHMEELFDGEEPLFDCTDYLTGKPEKLRVIIPNVGREGRPERQFWINPNDYCGTPVNIHDEELILSEVDYLQKAFAAEIKTLSEYYNQPGETGYVRWGYFIYEL